MADADFVMDGSQPLDPRKTIFVGGVPRPLRAGKLCCSYKFFVLQVIDDLLDISFCLFEEIIFTIQTL